MHISLVPMPLMKTMFTDRGNMAAPGYKTRLWVDGTGRQERRRAKSGALDNCPFCPTEKADFCSNAADFVISQR